MRPSSSSDGLLQGPLVSAQMLPKAGTACHGQIIFADLGVIARNLPVISSGLRRFIRLAFADLEITTQSLPVINRNSVERGSMVSHY
ncbi:hypothetical protein GO624_15845 [Aeromonas hydrophila]|uniref:hypothetical protein n=2 Tax=Aeromonas hydrophila TaxID=644 RepID=UPI001AF3A53E|nr:hypothetical protein [Aeromonas hydrophila]QSR61178.1 hypothetical protein GO623_15850 [Aeromonas hydrophila]QSR65381.1 hypothetical protein GO624_15845 [Aeromonas hydrophila]UMQ38875.1 hypothetical protein MJ578_06150 [Aeromonas hydrophila]UNU35708.1 hypothetical protein GCK66_16000 [Aeromonas hydrophila]UNU39926.1 hypothetical protein GET80_16060 [Aeromonas hydrophila]